MKKCSSRKENNNGLTKINLSSFFFKKKTHGNKSKKIYLFINTRTHTNAQGNSPFDDDGNLHKKVYSFKYSAMRRDVE